MTIAEIVEAVGQMTVLEVTELVREIREKYDIADMFMPMYQVQTAVEIDSSSFERLVPTEFDLVLQGIGPKKIGVIKAVREITGLRLRESKAMVDAAPRAILEAASQCEVDSAKLILEAAGATVEVRPK